MNTHHHKLGPRLGRSVAIGFTLVLAGASSTIALQSSAIAGTTIVPPGCGSLSGKPLPAGWTLNDHSADTTALGTATTPYQVPATANMLTIGTSFTDHVDGNDVTETFCGREGNDVFNGFGGDDVIHGDDGRDILSGSFGSDTLFGGGGKDTLYGDDATNSSGNLDFNDYLHGGQNADTLDGGNDGDDIFGDKGKKDIWTVDTTDTCVNVELPSGTC